MKKTKRTGEPRRYTKITDPRQIAALVRRYLAGESMAALTAHYDCDATTIRRIVSSTGAPLRKRGRPRKYGVL